MKDWDFEVAMAAWLLTIGATYWFSYLALPAAVLATINFWHQRNTLYDFGRAFEERVKDVLANDVKAFTDKFTMMEKAVEDIKEAQVNIAGAWRGKQRP